MMAHDNPWWYFRLKNSRKFWSNMSFNNFKQSLAIEVIVEGRLNPATSFIIYKKWQIWKKKLKTINWRIRFQKVLIVCSKRTTNYAIRRTPVECAELREKSYHATRKSCSGIALKILFLKQSDLIYGMNQCCSWIGCYF